MSTAANELFRDIPDFCTGILHFSKPAAQFAQLGAAPVVQPDSHGIAALGDAEVYQTQLLADALRYTTLQLCASKESGHPGGFASSADAYAALVMLGHTNIVTEVGHHAPGFYSAMFLDGSLEAMGIRDMNDLQARFRERGGLLGHLSGAIPGLLAPAGPLGQGQHFAMAGAYLHRDKLFPCTIGDGGLGEPYILSAMKHFHTSYPEVTNFLRHPTPAQCPVPVFLNSPLRRLPARPAPTDDLQGILSRILIERQAKRLVDAGRQPLRRHPNRRWRRFILCRRPQRLVGVARLPIWQLRLARRPAPQRPASGSPGAHAGSTVVPGLPRPLGAGKLGGHLLTQVRIPHASNLS